MIQEGVADGGNPFQRFERLSPRFAQVAFAWGLGQTGWKLGKRLHAKARERSTYTIKIQGTDEIFPDLHEWMLGLLPERERRALIAVTGDVGYGFILKAQTGAYPADAAMDEVAPSPPPVRLRYDGSKKQTVELDGHKVEVEVQRDEGRNWERIPDNWQALSQRMVFTTFSAAGRDAVLRHVQNLLEVKQEKPGPPPFRMSSRWGSSWERRSDLPPRTLDSIILKQGQLERLVADLGEFLASESDYTRRCLPWHRGYLFHGDPGTGKTSVAKALAHHFGLPVYYLPMGQMKEDAELVNLVSSVNPRSMLVLEDVDVFHAMTARNDEQGGVTLSAVLNALDGLWTPHGLITVLTTNDRAALDSALLRPGRVDIEEEFTNLDDDQAGRLATWFYGHRIAGTSVWPMPWHVEGRSPAELIGAMSRAKDDPKEALRLFGNDVGDVNVA